MRRLLLRPDTLYVLVCIGPILAWIVPTNSNDHAFLLTMLVMLPLSIHGFLITYVGGVFLFGPDTPSPFAKVCFIAFWAALAIANATLIRALVRSVRASRSLRRASVNRET